MRFVEGPVRVSVPATSANLGPGYDAFGLALHLRDTLEAEVTPAGLVVEVEGEGAGEVPLDEQHLVLRSMRAAFTELGVDPTGLRLSCSNRVPHARGLGSSSAAIVGGLALGRSLVVDAPQRLDDAALFALAARIEGHPDNVAPACFGGFTVSGHDADGYFAVRAPLDPSIVAMVFIPPGGVETSVARGLLPATVSHDDAAANAGRAALLVTALAGRPDQLLRGTHDLLHQEYRRAAMPDSMGLVDSLRAQGHAALISGAGPTVLVLTSAAETGSLSEQCPAGWRSLVLASDLRGVLVG